MKHADIITKLTLEQKMRTALRRDGLSTRGYKKCGHPVHHPVGRPQRRAQAGGCGGPSGPEPQRPRDLLPDGGYRGLQLGPRPGRTARPGHGGGGRRAGGIRPAGPGPQHQAQPAVRAQLRVFLGGPVPLRQAGRGYVRGIQSNGIAACPKHFAVNSQELRRMRRTPSSTSEPCGNST